MFPMARYRVEIVGIISAAEKSSGIDSRMSLKYIVPAGNSLMEVGVENRLRVALSRKLEQAAKQLSNGSSGIDIAIRTISMKDQKLLVVKAGMLNVRAGPSAESELITQLLAGEQLGAFHLHNGWYLVRMSDGYCGWVRSSGVLGVNRRNLEDYSRKVNKMIVSKRIIVAEVIPNLLEH
jgi:uncharacterized protein YgiM (DUF1202 family)